MKIIYASASDLSEGRHLVDDQGAGRLAINFSSDAIRVTCGRTTTGLSSRSDLLGSVFTRSEAELSSLPRVLPDDTCLSSGVTLLSPAARAGRNGVSFGYPDFSVPWLLPPRYRDGHSARGLSHQRLAPATFRQHADLDRPGPATANVSLDADLDAVATCCLLRLPTPSRRRARRPTCRRRNRYRRRPRHQHRRYADRTARSHHRDTRSVLSDSFTARSSLSAGHAGMNQGVHDWMVYGFGDIPVGDLTIPAACPTSAFGMAASTSAPAIPTSPR